MVAYKFVSLMGAKFYTPPVLVFRAVGAEAGAMVNAIRSIILLLG